MSAARCGAAGGRLASCLCSPSMTIGGSMSSGYCSLDEDLEDCFFTAKTSFFRSTQCKVPAKVTARKPLCGAGGGCRWPCAAVCRCCQDSLAVGSGAAWSGGALPASCRLAVWLGKQSSAAGFRSHLLHTSCPPSQRVYGGGADSKWDFQL